MEPLPRDDHDVPKETLPRLRAAAPNSHRNHLAVQPSHHRRGDVSSQYTSSVVAEPNSLEFPSPHCAHKRVLSGRPFGIDLRKDYRTYLRRFQLYPRWDMESVHASGACNHPGSLSRG